MKQILFLLVAGSLLWIAACDASKKQGSASSASSAVLEEDGITGKRWKLIELYGKPVADKVNEKEPFILLQATDSSYTASGGCNGIGGKFTLQEQGRITFSRGVSTMMACEHMWVEDDLRKALEETDNYTTGENTLSLNKARMAPLARFELAEQQEEPSAP